MRILSRHRYLLLVALIPLGSAAVFLVGPEGATSSAPRYVAVAELGAQNDSDGSILTGFAISNVSKFPVRCRVVGLQQLATNRTRTSTNLEWRWQPGWYSVSLQARQCISVTNKPPTNALPWRFAVFAECPPTLRWRVADVLESHVSRGLYWLLAGDPRRTQFFHSHEFIPVELRRLEPNMDGGFTE